MQVRIEKRAVEVDFIDTTCGCRKCVRVETGEEADTVTITARTFDETGGSTKIDEVQDAPLAAFKALAAAVLLLEV